MDQYKILQYNGDGSALIEFNFADGTGDTKNVYDLSDQGIANAAQQSKDIIASAPVLEINETLVDKVMSVPVASTQIQPTPVSISPDQTIIGG